MPKRNNYKHNNKFKQNNDIKSIIIELKKELKEYNENNDKYFKENNLLYTEFLNNYKNMVNIFKKDLNCQCYINITIFLISLIISMSLLFTILIYYKS